jgi:hypothetical protein
VPCFMSVACLCMYGALLPAYIHTLEAKRDACSNSESKLVTRLKKKKRPNSPGMSTGSELSLLAFMRSYF